ncbi:hypothetical protein [Leifsonia sp. TF02-11]|uniref:hypothetical protein n=1 Tax=Leifsonia sp. TF02-11 TaxID=2815212 RepID=UPI001AA17DFD|nr:hypothetical protein [Leifsonia sp. TF02-11]MBO1740799.1 hypothetical protein [Leifsonia sp. TF02-11]
MPITTAVKTTDGALRRISVLDEIGSIRGFDSPLVEALRAQAVIDFDHQLDELRSIGQTSTQVLARMLTERRAVVDDEREQRVRGEVVSQSFASLCLAGMLDNDLTSDIASNAVQMNLLALETDIDPDAANETSGMVGGN